VKDAVPTAIDWVMQDSESLIVFEDDCIPNQFALEYFDSCIDKIKDDVVLVSGSSLPIFPLTLRGYLYESKFPLIWGWALTRKSWALIRPGRKISKRRLAIGLLKNFRNLIPIFYFYAAVIRVERGFLKAWDSTIALVMLIENYKSLVPDNSVISNVGQDEVANHFENDPLNDNTIVTTSGNHRPSLTHCSDNRLVKELDKQMKLQIYNMKFRHIFSPLKSKFIGGNAE
jgi:hypothetical protein